MEPTSESYSVSGGVLSGAILNFQQEKQSLITGLTAKKRHLLPGLNHPISILLTLIVGACP